MTSRYSPSRSPPPFHGLCYLFPAANSSTAVDMIRMPFIPFTTSSMHGEQRLQDWLHTENLIDEFCQQSALIGTNVLRNLNECPSINCWKPFYSERCWSEKNIKLPPLLGEYTLYAEVGDGAVAMTVSLAQIDEITSITFTPSPPACGCCWLLVLLLGWIRN